MTSKNTDDRIKELEAELARRDARDQAMQIWLSSMPAIGPDFREDRPLPFGDQDLGVCQLEWRGRDSYFQGSGRDGYFQARHPIGFSCEVSEIGEGRWFCHVTRSGVSQNIGEFKDWVAAQRAAQIEFSRIVRSGLVLGAIPAEISDLHAHLEDMAREKNHAEEMFKGWRDEARKADTKLAMIQGIALDALEASKSGMDMKTNAGIVKTAIDTIKKAVNGAPVVRPVNPEIISVDLVNAMARALRLAEHDQIDLLHACRDHAKKAPDANLAELRERRAGAIEDRLAATRQVLRQIDDQPVNTPEQEGPAV